MSVCYLFEITQKSGECFFLTSSDVPKLVQNRKYSPACGLNLVSLTANDSGDNIAVIDGIYSNKAITKDIDLSDAKVVLYQLIDDELRLLGNLLCTFFSKQDLGFRILCNSEVIKLQTSLLQTFSKTCRAIFGDDKCKINPLKFSVVSEVLSFENNRITFLNSDTKISYNNGRAILSSNDDSIEIKVKIISHLSNMVDVQISSEIDRSLYKKITLIPACDKKYRTCCYSFNNKVNFRGEPHIPDINIIKN